MNGNCHFMFGAALGTALALNLDALSQSLPNITSTPETATLFVLGGILGGVIPDMDNPKSHIGKLTTPVSKAIGKMKKTSGTAEQYQQHRGFMHDPFLYILGLVLCYLYFSPLVGFFVGGLSHIFLDMFNPAGVPFLFGIKHLHLSSIKSNSKESNILTWILTILVLLVGIGLHFFRIFC